MSEIAYSSTRKLLTQHTNLVALVPANDIRIGFMLEPDVFPSISISQAGGDSWAYLGRQTSPAGSKMRRENSIMQIDIYSRSGVLNLEQISDQVVLALISGAGYRKVSDNDTFEDGLNAHRKIQTWSCWSNVDD